MRTTYTTLAIIFFMITVACKNESPKQSTEDEMPPRNEEITKTTNYEETGNFNTNSSEIVTTNDTLVTNWNLEDPERQQSLYARFQMNKDQIKRYEKALNDWKATGLENPYEKLSAQERIKVEDKILKDILDDAQYKRYRKWSNDNDKRGI